MKIKISLWWFKRHIIINNVLKKQSQTTYSLAAQSFPKTSFKSLDTLETNIQGTTRVLEALKEFFAKTITHICSSSEVFDAYQKIAWGKLFFSLYISIYNF